MTQVVAQARRMRLMSWCTLVVVFSDNPTFLSVFAEMVDKGRLMVWETKLLVITRLPLPNLQDLLKNYWSFSMMNTIFFKLNSSSGENRCQIYGHMPYGPTGSHVVQLASLNSGRVLVNLSDRTLFPEKYKNFYGMKVNLTWIPLTPYWMVMKRPGPNSTEVTMFSGREYWIMENIALILNFSLNPLPYIGWDPIEVWGLVLASVVTVYIALLMLNRSSKDKGPSAWLVMKQVLGTLLDEAIPGELPQRSTTRVVLTAWLIFSFVVGTVYRGNLTASLTIPKYPPRIETFSGLVDANTKILVVENMDVFYDNFRLSISEVLKTIAARMEIVPNYMNGMTRLLTENAAYLYERLFLEVKIAQDFTDSEQETPLYVTQGSLLADFTAFVLIRDAPFKPNFDYCLLMFHGAGLIGKWGSDVMDEIRSESRKKQRKEKSVEVKKIEGKVKPLTFVHLQGPLLLYLVFVIVSFALRIRVSARKTGGDVVFDVADDRSIGVNLTMTQVVAQARKRSTLAFTMAKPSTKPTWESLYRPLKIDVWGLVVASVVIVYIVLLMMNKSGKDKGPGAWLVMKQVLGTLLDEAIPGELPQRSTTRVVLTAWLIFSFVVGTVYRSNLTASLTIPKYPPRIETLSGLVDANTKQVDPYLYERLFLEVKIAQDFTDSEQATPLYVTQDSLLADFTAFVLIRDAPFKPNFDNCLLMFHGALMIRVPATKTGGDVVLDVGDDGSVGVNLTMTQVVAQARKVMKRLRTREAFLWPVNLPILPHMLELYDFSFFLERSTLAFTMAKPSTKPSWETLYRPLQIEVWGLVVASVVVVYIVLLMMNTSGKDKRLGAWLVMKQVLGTLLDEAIPGELPQRSTTRVVLTAWLIFSFVVGTVYRSNLTASLTIPKYPPRIETLSGLVDANTKQVPSSCLNLDK
ncbi:hypothetical protein O3P69_006853 [Scylla paramamosain]|uniref:Ionotropic glutamate receptor C-terminal domain-containing protein n=1 Tax=Scylla paramamosain TaxID=85552 RepID=A0AAW0U4G7_SCYPA